VLFRSEHGDPRFAPLVYAALGEAFLDKERYTDAAGVQHVATAEVSNVFDGSGCIVMGQVQTTG
jgi:hypothetical protein